MQQYPTVNFILRHGTMLAIGLAALVPLGALAMIFAGWSWLILPVGFVLGFVAFGLLMSYVEIIRIISDTLLPK